MDPTKLDAWQRLQEYFHQLAPRHMREMFDEDPARFERLSRRLDDDLLVDLSKHRIDDRALELLLELARQAEVEHRRDSMFSGEAINHTEQRSVLHVALRHRGQRSFVVDGQDVMPLVRQQLEKMRSFCHEVHTGQRTGHTGQPLRQIVNIGIGGSDLGPRMACQALKPYWRDGMQAHFVSNVDGTDIAETLRTLDPAQTLFIVASKSFTTQETLRNARTARRWLVEAMGGDEQAVARHFIALSTNEQGVRGFGIDPDNMFEFWDWVGGRYSMWSVIGMVIALTLGFEHFEAMLQGAHEIDEHFRAAPLHDNLPVLMALLGIWYRDFFGAAGHAVLPYDQYLGLLPAHLQQVDMESNGKGVDRDGAPIHGRYATGPIVFGQPGTNGQHAFYQLIHQGTELIPCDFIAVANSHNPLDDHHAILLANALAQPEALMRGKTTEEARQELLDTGHDPGPELDQLAQHKTFPGNRPSTTIVLRRLDPRALGRLVALYEHRIFVQGVIWNINSFDQWGVELGKQLAKKILPELQGAAAPRGADHDSSTAGLIQHLRALTDDTSGD